MICGYFFGLKLLCIGAVVPLYSSAAISIQNLTSLAGLDESF